jgi:FlaA1/EpsC-like NDP-sugar epimerase
LPRLSQRVRRPVGGAGSIGSETVKLLATHRAAALHVSDLSENYLADLVRELRNRDQGIAASRVPLRPPG